VPTSHKVLLSLHLTLLPVLNSWTSSKMTTEGLKILQNMRRHHSRRLEMVQAGQLPFATIRIK
jgi:hypothetical protein